MNQTGAVQDLNQLGEAKKKPPFTKHIKGLCPSLQLGSRFEP